MTKSYNLIVVIPVGPNEVLDYVSDTIDSIIHYTGPERKIILIDKTEKSPMAWVD